MVPDRDFDFCQLPFEIFSCTDWCQAFFELIMASPHQLKANSLQEEQAQLDVFVLPLVLFALVLVLLVLLCFWLCCGWAPLCLCIGLVWVCFGSGLVWVGHFLPHVIPRIASKF